MLTMFKRFIMYKKDKAMQSSTEIQKCILYAKNERQLTKNSTLGRIEKI